MHKARCVLIYAGGLSIGEVLQTNYFTGSISSGFQLWSNHGSSGP